ncbi:MAG: hypothetical protein PWR06_2022 [Thermoanaerobacteraceae bacterium]|nr:hypothetical protein [Thermoanaerobacteraceae bacterium]RKL64047.1 SDR family NAD(P)-dependent oxidoreductase [Thermoanaerobacteraceae bacterium SP2]
MTKKLNGKVAIITGGSSGFGRETALLFADEGAKVVIWDVDEKGGEDTVSAIKEKDGEASFFKVDVRFSAEIEKAAKNVEQLYGKVDVLVNSAGVHQYRAGNVVETPEEEYDKVMDTNVKGIFLSSKYLIPLMSDGGSIVNIASAWGTIVSNKVPIYCTSKAAAIQLTKAMAIDHAVDKIRVNCICPGTCKTPMVEKIVNLNYKNFGFDSPDSMWDSRKSAHPIGRLGTATDISKVILFLVSDDASWMTGSAIIVDGGYTLGKSFVGKR